MATGCATTAPPQSPKASACLQHSGSVVTAQPGTSRLSELTARADAFEACMSANGFVYDQALADKRLLKFETKRMFDLWSGDPFDAVQLQRQQLRLTPELWRPSAG